MKIMTKTKTRGILTDHLRKSLKKKKMPSNTKSNELDPDKGLIRIKINELPKDFEVIASSPHCWELLSDGDTRASLFRLNDVISKILKYHPTPLKRIKCVKKSKKRIFQIERMKLLNNPSVEANYFISNFSETDTSLSDVQDKLEDLRYRFYLDKIKEGSNLRTNEWNIILQHYNKYKKRNPFYMPLVEDKEYTWIELKHVLQNPEKIVKTTRQNEDSQYEQMFKILNPILDKLDKRRNKIINQDLDKINNILKKYKYKMDRTDYPFIRKVAKIT